MRQNPSLRMRHISHLGARKLAPRVAFPDLVHSFSAHRQHYLAHILVCGVSGFPSVLCGQWHFDSNFTPLFALCLEARQLVMVSSRVNSTQRQGLPDLVDLYLALERHARRGAIDAHYCIKPEIDAGEGFSDGPSPRSIRPG